jgi:outer membrane protease
MASSHDSIDGDDLHIPLALACRASDRIKSSVCVKTSQRSEPFYVSKRVRKCSKLWWKIENHTDLSDAKTYVVEKKISIMSKSE